MRSSRTKVFDAKKPIQLLLNTNIETEADEQQKKQFYHDEPDSDQHFKLQIIIPVISEIKRSFELEKFKPPKQHFIQHSYINYKGFMHETHYTLDNVDFDWLENEQKIMRVELGIVSNNQTTIQVSNLSNIKNSPLNTNDTLKEHTMDNSKSNTIENQNNSNHSENHENSISKMEVNHNEKYQSIITEEILEIFIDRFEKVMGKNQYGFSQVTDVELYVPKYFSKIQNIADIAYRIYEYWKDRRISRISKEYPIVGKPLLRHFQLPPDIDSDDPRLAFRPRDKELTSKVPLKNDERSLERLKLIHEQLSMLHKILWNIKNRELIHEEYIKNCYEIFETDLKYLLQSNKNISRKRKRQPFENMNLKNSTTPIERIFNSLEEITNEIKSPLIKLEQNQETYLNSSQSNTLNNKLEKDATSSNINMHKLLQSFEFMENLLQNYKENVDISTYEDLDLSNNNFLSKFEY